MKAKAHAKLNLSLQVRSVQADGFHPLRSLFQSISWSDGVTVETADDDICSVPGGGAPEGDDNVAWKALSAVREHAASPRPAALTIHKSIPAQSGLGGGSADAAATLILASRLFHVPHETVRSVAPQLGADVPFCLVGGSAIVTGRGELVAPIPDLDGFAVAVVVPPIELSTALVYARWDEMGEPEDRGIAASHLPPGLRELAPLGNDLYAAAVALDPQLAEWKAELDHRWGVSTAMTGSGSALFALFPSIDEAEGAVRAAPAGAQASRACEPVSCGWELVDR